MIKQIIVILSLFVSSTIAIPKTVPYNPIPSRDHFVIYNQIYKNNPKLEHTYVYRLAGVIIKAAKKHDLNPRKLSAILAQECRYKLDCINKVTKDYGIGQINQKTIKAFKLDKARLLQDLEYSVDSSAMVLADFKRVFGRREFHWYCRYNVGTAPMNLIKDKCDRYKTMVARFM